ACNVPPHSEVTVAVTLDLTERRPAEFGLLSRQFSYRISLIPYSDLQLRVVGGNPMARIPFVRHRTADQIRSKYRACRHPIEKTRCHAIWLLARTDEARTPARAPALVGLPAVTVRAGLHRWNAH